MRKERLRKKEQKREREEKKSKPSASVYCLFLGYFFVNPMEPDWFPNGVEGTALILTSIPSDTSSTLHFSL